MDLPDIYKQIFKILKDQGTTDEAINQMKDGLIKAASDQLYAQALQSLTEEDLKVIDACPNQEEANKEILSRFTQRTGKNPDDVIQEFLQNFAKGFLLEYQKTQVKQP